MQLKHKRKSNATKRTSKNATQPKKNMQKIKATQLKNNDKASENAT